MKVSVTAEDIANGIRKNCRGCPVALATQRTYETAYVWVNTESITIDYQDPRIVKTPSDVKRFVLKFDAGEPVFPFEFELEDA